MNIREEAEYIGVICTLLRVMMDNGDEIKTETEKLYWQCVNIILNNNFIHDSIIVEDLLIQKMKLFVNNKEFD